MITIRQKKIVTEQNVFYYPDLFSGPIITEISKKLDVRSITSLGVGLAMITQKIYKPRITDDQFGSLACIVLKDEKAFFEKGDEKIEIHCQPGSVFILGSQFRREWKYELPYTSIKLYEDNYLPGIYLSIKQRFVYAEKIRKSLDKLRKLPCIQKVMPSLELIGKGSYGNVFKAGYMSHEFAMKFSKLNLDSINHPYDLSFLSWHEVYFLRDIFKPLIKKNICPNLPLIYDTFTCDSCELVIDDEKLNIPCVITVIEIASGNLKQYFQNKRSTEELKSALFQIMAAIHTIQIYAQIMNFDIKKENILYYDVEPGGYWRYKIRDEYYYVPNFGKLFILNDFGISRTMSPKYPIYKTNDKSFHLGSRYAIIKDGKFLPFDTTMQYNEKGKPDKPFQVKWNNGNSNSLGVEFRLDRGTKSIIKVPTVLNPEIAGYLKRKNITANTYSFFQNPEIIPPFEFYNDLQDALRMFIGGKRTTQKGHHKKYCSISTIFFNELLPYLGKGDSANDRIFSDDPAQVLAGYFIESFFSEYKVEPENVKIIATYLV